MHACLCTQSRVDMGVCACARHRHSSRQLLRGYLCICMLTPLNDCNYISPLTVNNEVLGIKKGMSSHTTFSISSQSIPHTKKITHTTHSLHCVSSYKA